MVAPGLYAAHHQHFFCVRMEMQVDGPENSVYEVDSQVVPTGSANPSGTAWEITSKLLSRESAGSSTVNQMVGRYWMVANPNVKNAFDIPVAYNLVPGKNISQMAEKNSFQARRGAFTHKQLWVTAYEPSERYAAGDYPWQNPEIDGVARYVKADRPLENTAVVLWYVFGAHHVVRPEDWPVMSTFHIGFHLKPNGFFDYNPAMDLPEPSHECSSSSGGHQHV
jgi:primary-amine oxidase